MITSPRSAAVLLPACHNCHCHCLTAFWLWLLLLFRLRLEGKTCWQALDSGRVNIVVDDKGLLLVRVLCDCRVVVCMSRLPLPLPSDCVPVVVVAAVVFRLPLPLSNCVPVAIGGKDVMVTKMLILLLMMKYCCWEKQTKMTS